jgi:flagellar biosynthesis protein FliP|tara:strand:+ start:804 stop:1214 length:411 start_codon:yes stop_codon:yes gene_type:complete
MNSFENEGLKHPPIHPKFPQKYVKKEVARNISIQQSIEDMEQPDKEFMYEQRKHNLHTERLLTASLRLIRKYCFLPKATLVQTYQHAIKHVYKDLDRKARDEARAERALEQMTTQLDETQLQEIEEIANEFSQENT